MGLKSHPKLNTQNYECLVKFSDQKTKGIGCSKTHTESEQNRFSENKMSWLFFPISHFYDLFMDVPLSQGVNSS